MKPLRYIVAIPLLFAGTWIFIAAPLLGYGVDTSPQPGLATLFGFCAALAIFLGYALLAHVRGSATVVKIASVVFLLGGIRAILAIGTFTYEKINHVAEVEAGYSAKGTLEFGILYGLLSLVCLIVLRLAHRQVSAGARS